MPRTFSYLLAGLALTLALVTGGTVYYANYQPDRVAFPLRGIDVSHHQGTIDWQGVAGDDVDFVYIKASEGGDHIDPAFASNWRGTDRATLVRGAYHFFTFCRSGAEQAANYIAAVPVDTRALPPALDLELGGNCALRPSRADVRAEIKVWLDAVEAHYGKRAILYMTEEFHDAYYSGSGLIRRLWLRSIARKPGFGPPWKIWQYHNRGRVQGIAGNVDLNVMAGANVSLR